MISAHDFFITAMANKAYTNRTWVLASFSIIMDKPEYRNTIPYYPFYEEQMNSWAYIDPESKEVIGILQTSKNTPILTFKEPIEVKANALINIKEDIQSRVGIVFANTYIFADIVGDRIDFINGELTDGVLKNLYNKSVVSNGDPREKEHGFFNVTEFKAMIDNGYQLTGFASICVPSGSEETMALPDEIIALRDKLLEEHKDELDNPLVIADIQDQVLAAYKEILMKSPSKDFFIKGKTINDAFNKMYIMIGLQKSFTGDGKSTFIANSLSESTFNREQFPSLVNSAISTSYDRGASTAKGGEEVKYLIRTTQNIKIVPEDCGTKTGIYKVVNNKKLIGSYIFDKGKTVLLSEDNYSQYQGQTILFRSPVACHAKYTDFCQYCVGEHNAKNERGMSSGASAMGSKWMMLSMKSMHKGSKINVVKFNVRDYIS